MVSREIKLFRLLIPHWKRVGIALLAVPGATVADVLQPWPLKIVLDYGVAGHQMPGWLAAAAKVVFNETRTPSWILRIVAVNLITIVDSVSSYLESYMMTSVGQWECYRGAKSSRQDRFRYCTTFSSTGGSDPLNTTRS